jgi:hypothetical protein
MRVVRIVGLLLILPGVALLITSFVTSQSYAPPAFGEPARVWTIAMGLLGLSLVCTFVCLAYRTRLGRPGLGPLSLDSSQSQVRAILLLSALPLCGIALALVIPPTYELWLFWFGFPILFVLAAAEAVVVSMAVVIGMAGNGPMLTPPPTTG